MNEYDDLVREVGSIGPGRAITSINENPEQGARALQLSRATGVPPIAVHQDLAGFQSDYKASLASELIRGNSKLDAYVRNNPLADVVSNDDYGNLDSLSKKSQGWVDAKSVFNPTKTFVDEPLMAAARGAVKGAYEGFTAPLHGQNKLDRMKETAPYSWAAWQLLALPVRGITGLAEGTFGAASEFAGKLAEGFGYDESGVASAKREARGIVESEMGRAGSHEIQAKIRDGQFIRAKEFIAAKVAEVQKAAKPWTDAGLEPPRGVHPLIDQAKEHINSEFVKQLDDIMAEAQKSLTKGRDPELFQEFVKQHFEQSTIGISGDRIAALYGDRIPEPGDGLLGFIPGIKEKIEAAKIAGDDVHVSVSDWVGKVDPALAKELRDDIRAWPGGITKTEALEKIEPKPIVDSPMAQMRAASGLEPVFAIGDRKLTLEAKAKEILDGKAEYHRYSFLDQNGADVGYIDIFPDPAKKQLYVGMIGGNAGLNANSFGPSLIRDLKRQLKELYPDYDTITGHRVSGARYARPMIEREAARLAGADGFNLSDLDAQTAARYYDRASVNVDNTTDHPVVKLSLNEIGGEDLGKLLDGVYKQQFSQGVSAYMLPKRMWLENEHLISRAVEEEIARITGGTAEAVATHGIQHDVSDRIRGVYLNPEKQIPQILFDLMDPEARGIARHEAIHHLYRSGLFTAEEWAALNKASQDLGWRERYKIDDRYKDVGLDEGALHEEAIAEAYREWKSTKDTVAHPDSLVVPAFQKIEQLLQAIKQRVSELLGWTGDIHDLFERVDSGEIGRRDLGATEVGTKFSLSPEDYQVKLDNLRAEAANLDLRSWKKLQNLIQERYKEDLSAALNRAEREQKRTQSKEWKDNAREIRKEVEESIRQRPDVAAELLIAGGELNGQKLRQRYPLRTDDLTDAQRAELPRHYYSEDGLPVDGVASLFGFHSGDALVDSLTNYVKQKEDRSVQEHLKKVIDNEVQRQMEAKFGELNENIMLEARDQALSETNLNILAEEWQGAAMQAGVQVVDKDFAKATAQQLFSGMKIGEVNRDRLMSTLGKHGRDAERALIAGNPAQAVLHMERKYMIGLLAAEAMKLEKEQAKFDRTARQFSKREVSSVSGEYTNFIHDILVRVGKPVRRSVQDIAKEIEAGVAKNLEDFVQYKEQDLRVVPVWDQLFDKNWAKHLDELTVEEFRAVKGSIDTLVHNGRDEKKIYRAGEAEDFAMVKQQLAQRIVDSAFGKIATVNRGKGTKLPMSYFVNHLQMENIMGRWDGFDPQGPWFQYVLRDLIDGTNQADVWRTDYAKKIKALGTPKDIGRTIENTLFKDTNTGDAFQFTRKNLLTVMLNTGNEYNLSRIAKGYGLEPTEVMGWITKHATKEEWQFVQGIWNIFKDIKDRSDTMYRGLSGGIAPKDVITRPVIDAMGRQVAEGGYYPIIFHAELEGASKKLMGPDVLMMDNFVNTLPSAGYTKERTGYVAPLSLDMDMMTNRIAQMLHDTATRPAILNSAKVFKDPEIRATIRKHFGTEYRDELLDYLKGVANSQNYIPRNQQALVAAGEFIRQNMITTLVGFNPGTVMKHGPTAAWLSAKEVGFLQFGKVFGETVPEQFMHWTRSLFNLNDKVAETNWDFAVRNSLELQRRDRNWQESLYGATAGLTPGDKFGPWRQRIMEWSSKPVALSDMVSAVPTWLAKYHEELGNGASHGDAVLLADRSVRRAHGSTAATNRTAFQRNWTPWLTSIYNFWSEIMNRQVETIWKAGEAAHLTDGNTLQKGMSTVPILAGGMMAYVIWPAIVESFVSPHEHDQKDSWAKKAGMQLGFTLGSSWVGVRDIVSGLTQGRDPQFGLTGTAYQHFSNIARDFSKKDAFSKDRRGKFLQDAGAFIGAATGMLPLQISKMVRFGHDVELGKEHPRNTWQWLTGLRYGTTDKHPKTFEDYMKGKH